MQVEPARLIGPRSRRLEGHLQAQCRARCWGRCLAGASSSAYAGAPSWGPSSTLSWRRSRGRQPPQQQMRQTRAHGTAACPEVAVPGGQSVALLSRSHRTAMRASCHDEVVGAPAVAVAVASVAVVLLHRPPWLHSCTRELPCLAELAAAAGGGHSRDELPRAAAAAAVAASAETSQVAAQAESAGSLHAAAAACCCWWPRLGSAV